MSRSRLEATSLIRRFKEAVAAACNFGCFTRNCRQRLPDSLQAEALKAFKLQG
ncbi:hypothetical protein [Paenibacillus agricola]|uniref:Cyclic lactone autoinducer peptide n=1 Tax=Paenibacillus agricola TaxID=2716264 RepID=A0ABX0JDT8_9BACL|nr:hypothetical protein [Paenibacillus agricola]NHN33424.1 hypothetical protein [Paenibacillus agricola]